MFEFDEIIGDNAHISDNINNDEMTAVDFITTMPDETKTGILEITKGSSFNENGDVIGENGDVIITADDLRNNLSGGNAGGTINIADLEAIDIDGVEYSINENGEAVDKDGKVVKTAEEVLALVNEHGAADDEVSIDALIADANALTGFEFTDENGNPISFDGTAEGIANRDRMIAQRQGSAIAERALNSLFDTKPQLRELYEFMEINGSADGFSFGESKLEIELDKTNDNQHRDLIVRAQKMKGNSPEMALQIANAIIDDGKGFDTAKSELAFINGRIDNANAIRTTELQNKRNAELQQHQQHVNEVNRIVTSGKIGDISIPPVIKTKDAAGNNVVRSREDFVRYYTAKVDGDKTQYEIDNASQSAEDKLINALVTFTGNTRESLIKGATTTSNIKFRRKTVEGAGSNANARSTGGGKTIDPKKVIV